MTLTRHFYHRGTVECVPEFHPKTLTLRIDIRWNALYAQLQCILDQKHQIDKFVDSVQHLRASDKIPLLDADTGPFGRAHGYYAAFSSSQLVALALPGLQWAGSDVDHFKTFMLC
jgi:hypothetical protein